MTAPSTTQYELVVGMEVHAQLLTKSKMFCSCSVPSRDASPNSHVCPVCLGMPGTLPVINEQAVEHTIVTGLALNCGIPERAKFDRKNYHYPDLMKGYQISQFDLPLCKEGWLEVEADGVTKRIGVTRVHLEEDTARHRQRGDGTGEEHSLVDVNRSGLPLMEIVSEPDIRSAEEARQYLIKLQQILRYLGVSRANLEDGNMRCEPNVSLRPVGRAKFGTKVELKNLNSFRAVYLGIEFEIERQRALLDAGKRVAQETRGWREETSSTVSQRSKELAEDYRYFPEPDLPTLSFRPAYIDELRGRMPELPDAKRERFMEQYGLTEYEANLLTATVDRAGYYERAVAAGKDDSKRLGRAKPIANWMLGDFTRLLNANNIDITDAKIQPEQLHALIVLIEEGTVSNTGAKTVFEEMFKSGSTPQTIVEEQGLVQISAAEELSAVIAQSIAQNPKAVADYQAGKETAVKFLMGQVMRETRGRAKPDLVQQLLKEQLGNTNS